ncbi:MAG: ABC transporter permease subunit [Spirochaetales bacterium]|nr:ABC transporter permease subunit [Spirochaetales bacterium]
MMNAKQEYIRRTKKNKIITNPLTPAKLGIFSIFSFLILLTIIGFFTINSKGMVINKAIFEALEGFKNMFFRPKSTRFDLAEGMILVLQTLALAFITTLVGSGFALILGLLAAKNITNEKLSNAIKMIISFIRAIPTVLWVLIFAIGAGLGAVAAVVGMSFHTIGYLVKAYSESFEEIDGGVIEALRASGANWIQIIFQAILPSSATYLLSWTFFRFEINFAVAVAMGAAAGAGGIGFHLFNAAGFYHDIREIGVIVYLVLAVALIMELIAIRLKSIYHIHE